MPVPDITKSASSAMVFRARDGTYIQVAVYDNAVVRVLMERLDGTLVDKTITSKDT